MKALWICVSSTSRASARVRGAMKVTEVGVVGMDDVEQEIDLDS
jgi:hypothetical protein